MRLNRPLGLFEERNELLGEQNLQRRGVWGGLVEGEGRD